jgi:hypothetical protein
MHDRIDDKNKIDRYFFTDLPMRASDLFILRHTLDPVIDPTAI